MVRGKSKTRKYSRRIKKFVPKSRERTRSRKSNSTVQSSRNSLGSMIHRGIRSVLTLLPGSTITAGIADLIFKSLSTGSIVSPGVFEVRQYSLHTAFFLTPQMLLGNTTTGSSTINSASYNPEARKITINYRCFRISHFKIVARNTSLNATGIWAIGFWPFNNYEDEDKLVKKEYCLADIRMAPYFVEGPAMQPLTLRHYFTINETRARRPGVYSDPPGLVVIVYCDISRDSYGNFSTDAFKPQIDVFGNVVMSSRDSSSTLAFSNNVKKVETVDVIRTPDGIYHSDGDVKYEDRGSYVRMTGNFIMQEQSSSGLVTDLEQLEL